MGDWEGENNRLTISNSQPFREVSDEGWKKFWIDVKNPKDACHLLKDNVYYPFKQVLLWNNKYCINKKEFELVDPSPVSTIEVKLQRAGRALDLYNIRQIFYP